MKTILIAGAGRSASSLIQYILKICELNQWNVTIADHDLKLAEGKTQGHPRGAAIQFDVTNEIEREKLVSSSDIIISLLPPTLHMLLANTCLKQRKNLLTASYIPEEMRVMDEELKSNGILFLNECGLDPGLDHMTAVQTLERIKQQGGRIRSFKSFTGGLVAPEHDNNPWHYKFTWNPRNVVLAGQGSAAKYLEDNQLKFVPYHQLFTRTEPFLIEGMGNFEGYPNRDSLSYQSVYGLDNVSTMIRGTLRRPGFCEAWNALVQLGMTEDTYIIDQFEGMTSSEFTNLFLPGREAFSVEDKLCNYLNISPGSVIFNQLKWLGLFSGQEMRISKGTPAVLLQSILEDKWKLENNERDMIVMQHLIEYEQKGKHYQLASSIIAYGEDATHTAMSKTVGLPLGVAAKLILEGMINEKGLMIPIKPSIYEPVLTELETLGIKFLENEILLVD